MSAMSYGTIARDRFYRATLEMTPMASADASNGDEAGELSSAEIAVLSALAADFVAPLALEFVRWVQERATQKNVRVLYFVSRDAQIFFKAACLLNQRTPSLRYFKISRRLIWRSFMAPAVGPQPWLWQTTNLTVRGLFLAVDANIEEFTHFLNRIGYSHDRWDEILPLDSYKSLCAQLLAPKHAEFWENVFLHRRNLTDYLKQEGLFEEGSVALVDSGWAGSTQNMLSSIMKYEGAKSTLHGFYLGLKYVMPNSEAYVFGPNDKNHWLEQKAGLMEMLLTADHAGIESLRREGTRIVPVENHFIRHHEQTASVMHRAILDKIPLRHSAKGDGIQQLRRFIEAPNRAQTQVLNRLIFAQRGWDGGGTPLAKVLNTREFADTLLNRKDHQLPWPEGSLINTAWALPSPILCAAYRLLRRPDRKMP